MGTPLGASNSAVGRAMALAPFWSHGRRGVRALGCSLGCALQHFFSLPGITEEVQFSGEQLDLHTHGLILLTVDAKSASSGSSRVHWLACRHSVPSAHSLGSFTFLLPVVMKSPLLMVSGSKQMFMKSSLLVRSSWLFRVVMDSSIVDSCNSCQTSGLTWERASCGCAQYEASLRNILLYKEGRGRVSSGSLGGLAVGPVYEMEA